MVVVTDSKVTSDTKFYAMDLISKEVCTAVLAMYKTSCSLKSFLTKILLKNAPKMCLLSL